MDRKPSSSVYVLVYAAAGWRRMGMRLRGFVRRVGAICALSSFVLAAPRVADAFCGFYVSGADAKLFNNATQVVLMREGTRTVLSMQNNYQGPPESFALVIPVPVILQKENVKTLPREIFEKVDTLTAPRLVEYWEEDPCAPQLMMEAAGVARGMPVPAPMAKAGGAGYGVKIEAQFTVGEYEIVILSAKDATGLDAWLRDNHYKIPAGAEPYLRPYVQKGSKFFVAKVNPQKVKFERMGSGPEQAILSPLRFHYDSESFDLPIRLGLINSAGTQDLIVNVLARGQRYEVANYPNVTIPTNLDVVDGAKEKFAPFYTALFDKTLETHPRAVVTEYAWDAGSCDPCPTPGLTASELMTLGMDALPSTPPPTPGPTPLPPGAKPAPMPPAPRMPPPMWGRGGFVVTRLHARYGKDALGEDLVFRAAPPIQGGREWRNGDQLEKGAVPGGINNFQARYAIRHPWTGPIACANPIRGRWGGPPGTSQGFRGGSGPVQPAPKLAFTPHEGVQLAAFVKEDVPEIGLKAGTAGGPTPSSAAPSAEPPSTTPTPSGGPAAGQKTGGCAGCAITETGRAEAVGLFGAVLGLAVVAGRRLGRRRG
jgi:hypothetical protein